MSLKKTNKSHDLEKFKYNIETSLQSGIDFSNRIIRITGNIGQLNPHSEEEYFDFNLLEVALTEMEKSSQEDITVKIHSFGGSVHEALAIVGRLKASPCKIITEGYGAVMSAATLILMSGDHRRLSRFAVSMFHAAQYGVGGDHENIKEQVHQAEKEEKSWATYYEEFSKKPASWWLKKMKKTEYYPTAKEMKEIGAIDEII